MIITLLVTKKPTREKAIDSVYAFEPDYKPYIQPIFGEASNSDRTQKLSYVGTLKANLDLDSPKLRFLVYSF